MDEFAVDAGPMTRDPDANAGDAPEHKSPKEGDNPVADLPESVDEGT